MLTFATISVMHQFSALDPLAFEEVCIPILSKAEFSAEWTLFSIASKGIGKRDSPLVGLMNFQQPRHAR